VRPYLGEAAAEARAPGFPDAEDMLEESLLERSTPIGRRPSAEHGLTAVADA
jgi:hypothetical protein